MLFVIPSIFSATAVNICLIFFLPVTVNVPACMILLFSCCVTWDLIFVFAVSFSVYALVSIKSTDKPKGCVTMLSAVICGTINWPVASVPPDVLVFMMSPAEKDWAAPLE